MDGPVYLDAAVRQLGQGPPVLDEDAIPVGKVTVPIAAVFPIEQIRDAVALQAGRHVHGKIVVTL